MLYLFIFLRRLNAVFITVLLSLKRPLGLEYSNQAPPTSVFAKYNSKGLQEKIVLNVSN